MLNSVYFVLERIIYSRNIKKKNKCIINVIIHQIRRLFNPGPVPRVGARLSPTSGDARSSRGHADSRTGRFGPLPPPRARRGRPHVGHGFRTPNPQDRRGPQHAQDRREADAHVLSYLPQADTGPRSGLSP